MPYTESINLPLLEPQPACGLSNDDLTYELVSSDSLPNWATFDAQDRVVDLEINDSVTQSGSVRVEIEAKYEDVTRQISFAVSFINGSEPIEQEPVVPTVEPEPEPEPEVVEVKASTWDGWKTLLQQYNFMPEGVVLPPPNPDPAYIPTPPKPTFNDVDARGKT